MRSESYLRDGEDDCYVEAFLSAMDLSTPKRVFDMGCGTGALALPLARAGHDVIAADFSENMLSILEEAIVEGSPNSLSGKVRTMLMSWDDDWETLGLYRGCVDIAIASRSLSSVHLEERLKKLSRLAKEKVYITINEGFSPHIHLGAMQAMGLKPIRSTHVYDVRSVLDSWGVAYSEQSITSVRRDFFANEQEAFEKLSGMVAYAHELTEEETVRMLEKLSVWLSDHLKHDKKNIHSTVKPYYLDEDRTVRWILFSWDSSQLV